MTTIPQVMVYAPPGAGKTRHVRELMEMFGCTSLVDGWDGKQPLPEGALVLTNSPAALREMRRRSTPSANRKNRDVA